MFNSRHYWTVCWAGVAKADKNLNYDGCFDVAFNPIVKKKFMGSAIEFPFTFKDLKKHGTFGEIGNRVLELLTSDTLVVGHAFENDLKMLIDVCKKFNLKTPEFDYVDTNVIYNAAFNSVGEHSLKSLADEFNIEFSPHNPAEDARATLLLCKAILKDEGIFDFLERTKITLGGLKNSITKKCYYDAMPQGQKQRIKNFNSVFETVERLGQAVKGEKYFIDSQIASECDMSELVESLLNSGIGVSGSAFCADRVITNNLFVKADSKNISLKSMLKKLGLSSAPYTLKPAKIRDAKGKSISLADYYKLTLKKYAKSGVLNGKKIAFSRTAERQYSYEEIIIDVVKNGGQICVRVENADILVVKNMSELNSKTDGRIRAYNYSKKAKVILITELEKMLNL